MIGRRKKASPLPSRVYEKNGAWYFVDIKRKWHKLCRVSAGLTELYTALASVNRDRDERQTNTMPALIDSWLLAKLSSYAAKTQEEYRRMATFIRSESDSQWLVEDVEPKDIARFLDKHFDGKPPRCSGCHRKRERSAPGRFPTGPGREDAPPHGYRP